MNADQAAQPEAPAEPAKRLQILEGARVVFRARGYDGASMEMIAREAGVSKGTLYVYFPNKEELFKALIIWERADQAERGLMLTQNPAPVREVLYRTGLAYVSKMCQPERVSTFRMVVGAAEQFPEFGALLYEAGPKRGTDKLAAFFKTRIATGELKTDCDVEMAAGQFFSLCVSQLLRRILLNVEGSPAPEEIERHVASAVDVFLAAYGTEPQR
ncbi:TetR/AcrR family transcriptional regulator [Roseibium litorale]|uniref:TetR/AcrR family transcriptional regulator n=1 Tax=Roseibium litorale TaxID=2803841 RepID=A0ABR9CJ58_9HYPH|nr:TetR/AcrR family transcriptional regulator [Roseibium litorale]MBD8890851.1 TetR/AcrR family transcriptional regulator [Roseibium litorale]